MPERYHICPNCYHRAQLERPCEYCLFYGMWGDRAIFGQKPSVAPPPGMLAQREAEQNVQAMLSEQDRPSAETMH